MRKFVLFLAALLVLSAATVSRGADEKIADLVNDMVGKIDEFKRMNAVLALGQRGKDAVEPVAAVLFHWKADVRYYAVWALGLIGPDARSKTKDVLKLLKDNDEEVRRKAHFALSRIAAPEDSVPVLLTAFTDRNPEIRELAAKELERLGSAAAGPLVEVLNSNHPQNRIQAGDTLSKIGKAAIPALAEAIKSDNSGVRARAVAVLGKMEAADAVDALVEAMASPRPDTRSAAVEALAPRSDLTRAALLAIIAALNDEEPDVQTSAYTQMRWLGKQHWPAVVEEMERSEGKRRVSLAVAFVAIFAPPPPRAVKIVADALADTKAEVRYHTALCLSRADIMGDAAVKGLVEALKAEDAKDRELAMDALTRMASAKSWSRPAAEADAVVNSLLEALIEVLASKEPGPQDRAMKRLQPFGPKAKAAVPNLIAVLKEGDKGIRWRAAETLGMIGPAAKKAVAALKDAAKETDPMLKTQAELALKLIEIK